MKKRSNKNNKTFAVAGFAGTIDDVKNFKIAQKMGNNKNFA